MKTPLQKAGIAVFGVVLVLIVFTLGQSYMMAPEEQVAAYQMLDELEQQINTSLDKTLSREQQHEQVHSLIHHLENEQIREAEVQVDVMDSLISQNVVSEMSESMRQEIGEAVEQEIEAAKQNASQVQAVGDANDIKLLAKLLFTLLFGVAALYVVLSNKYPEETQKWAFSVLSLIAGVWIGNL